MAALHVHRSPRIERLVEALGDLLAEPRGGPFEPELVTVQGRGMSVWLGNELAKRFGVWATPMLHPRGLIERIVRDVLGDSALGEPPVTEDTLFWAVQAALPELLAEPELVPLARYCAGDEHGVRTAQLAGRIATVLDQYLTYRPDWISAWERGDDAAVPAGHRWQPRLWRAVIARIARPHVAGVRDQLVQRLASGESPAKLPPRISLFGISTLPPTYARVLGELSRHVDVHCFLFSASGTPWDADSLRALATDFDQILSTACAEAGQAPVEHTLDDPPARDSGTPAITVHSCHGPMREVEVLHDQLLELLTRETAPVAPEQVAVLVPDLETYAPLIEAVFARDPGHRQFIPYRVADRPSSSESPVLTALHHLLRMVRGRVTATELLELLAVAEVQRRFDLGPTQLETLEQWVDASGARWGIDAEHRRALGLPPDVANTWQFGLRRLLLGHALPAEGRRLFADVLAFDEIEGKQALVLGNFAHACRTLFRWLRELERPRTLEDWAGTLDQLGRELFADSPDGTRQRARVRRAFESAAESAASVGHRGHLDVFVVRELLTQWVDAGSAERGFLAGGVTFCAMVPMRSIPFRVLGLLGMNDGDFPRSPRPLEIDLIKHPSTDRRPGDRSRRDDDRYLFLETLCAAREQLIITYTGQSVRDNRTRPPSVCVAELLDSAPDAVRVVRHRLQGFSPAYFDGEQAALFSYSEQYAAAADRLARGAGSARRFVQGTLEAAEPGPIRLADLQKFFDSPAGFFLSRRLGLRLERYEVTARDREPLELDQLEQWSLGDALVERALGGSSLEQAEALVRGAGGLPLGSWGKVVLEELGARSRRIAERVARERGDRGLEPLDVELALDDGTRLTGTIVDRWDAGVVSHTYSTLRPKRLLRAWIAHLAACAGAEPPERSVLVGRKGDGADARVWSRLERGDAIAQLAVLVRIFRTGQERPLPFLPATSHAYATRVPKSEPAALAAAIQIYAEGDFPESQSEPHLELAFGGLLPPFDADWETGGHELSKTDFHQLALDVWAPVVGGLA